MYGNNLFGLFSPKQLIEDDWMKKRLVRSATCEYQMTTDGKITNVVLNVYRELAGGGMIISSLMAVTPSGKAVDRQICIFLGRVRRKSQARKVMEPQNIAIDKGGFL